MSCFFFKASVLLTMSASSLLIVLRMYVFSNTSTFRNQPLIEVASIAIRNRNRVVMAMAIIIWGVTAVVYVQCRLLLSCHVGGQELNISQTWLGHSSRVCEYSIPNMFNNVLIPSIASLGTGTWPTGLCTGQPQKHSNQPHWGALNRHRITSHHAHWLISPSRSWW